ncbi:MAG: quinolinate synthase NadA [Betaproteobacteria bacterium]|jgi:quinolinate synthase|nr:MAG: quinolinate synthase NadA [Betaproteobacteria bacterium]
MNLSQSELESEIQRLYDKLNKLGWAREDCEEIAPMTLEINHLKQEQNAVILAHSYQTPDIMYGVGDFVGDSYGLSVKATDYPADKIVFCSVYFMGETAKLLNPHKEVLVPGVAGCSLADSITVDQVRALRKMYPQAGVACYVNTYAEIKAESDVCVTSSNVVDVVEAMPQEEIIFIPDKLMGQNLRTMTSKKIITWEGTCIVHEGFDENSVKDIRRRFPDVKILAHPECTPGVVSLVDYAGGTSGMLNYVKRSPAKTFMLVTECGLTDRFKAEFQNKEIVGTCILCPYMKEIKLEDVFKALKNPDPRQYVEIDQDIAHRARASLDKMFELEKLAKRQLATG